MKRIGRFVTLGLLLQALAACGQLAPTEAGDRPSASQEPGAELLGLPLPGPLPQRWIGEPVEIGAGRATLIRFWTDTCPYCSASLPAVEALAREYGPRGLQTVGIYHPKPPREVDDEAIAADARERGYSGPLAVDPRWATLRQLWLDGGSRSATSASLLVDRQGVVRAVHPGPEFHASDDPAHARCDADDRALRKAIEGLLDEG